MSGLVNVEPTAGGCPPGRNTRAVAGNLEKRSAFWAVWSWKVWSTTKPLAARRSAGLSAWLNDGVPGTPTDRPELTAVAKGYGWPVAGSMNALSVKDIGAVSRPSMVLTFLER